MSEESVMDFESILNSITYAYLKIWYIMYKSRLQDRCMQYQDQDSVNTINTDFYRVQYQN